MMKTFLSVFALIFTCCNLVFAANLDQTEGGGFFRASYIYWHASEDGLTLGRGGNFLIGDDPFLLSSNELLNQSFKYASGFKAGVGWEYNPWTLSVDYTWIRNSTSQSVASPAIDPLTGNGVWLIAPWFLQEASDGGSLSGTNVASKWRLSMDVVDVTLGHLFKKGSFLKMTPFGGVKVAFIRQKFNIALTETPDIFPSLPAQPIYSINNSNSWSVGPRFGSDAIVMLGKGFGIDGRFAFNLLFTEYTKIFHQEDEASSDVFPLGGICASMRDRKTLSPVMECGLGLKWEKIFTNGHDISLLANYDFMIWWNQNLMRQMLGQMWNATQFNGDLYLHGLTLSASLGF